MFGNFFENKTLSILKPDATRRNITGKINHMIEEAGFVIIAQKKILMTRNQAENFYEIHKDRPFFDSLVKSMICGPVVVQVLQKENPVEDYRKLMGATDPQKADIGTIRASHGLNIGENTVHGSDSDLNAKREIHFFFAVTELI